MAKILIVDDDLDFIETTRTILETEGHDVDTANGEKQALECMKNNVPDLVLLDFMMSYVMEGFNVIEQMRSSPKLKDVPVLVVSSLKSDKSTGVYQTDNLTPVDEWLDKPVQPDELLQKATSLLSRPETKLTSGAQPLTK